MDRRTELELTIDSAKSHRFSILELENNHLTRLPASIGDLPHLTDLSLRCNQLTSLPESIGNLSSLTKLNLRYNQLTSLPESIGNLSSLTEINLRYNQLTSLPKSIGKLSNLTQLDLGYNQLTEFPDSMIKLSNLTTLHINVNPLKNLSPLQVLPRLHSVYFLNRLLPRRYWIKFSDWKPEWFLDEEDWEIRKHLVEQLGSEEIARKVGTLSSEYCLTNLSENICNFTHLKFIDLQNSQLSNLPNNIGNLTNLTILNLYNNQITSLPESIGNLSNLTELNLMCNQIASLPESIGNLSNLTKLNLCVNQLTSLPENISSLSSLTELILANNQLSSLPENISNLSNLIQLNLSNNNFIDLSILQNITNLKIVYCFDIELPRRYWTKFSEWKPEWLLDEDNAEIRRVLVEQVGYEKICEDLNADKLDTWREYILLKIDGVEAVYEDEDEPIEREPMVLLKMTCPSTEHIHILRVPPEMTSAEAAITWVNHGIHPDKFAIQT